MKYSSIISKIINKLSKTIKEPVLIPVLESRILFGKTVLITGGTGDIGFAIAKRCSECGAKVIIGGRNLQKLKEATDVIDESIPFVIDISDVENMENSFNDLVASVDRIDILINNAGVQTGSAIGKTTEVDFDNVINTNLRGTYFITQLFSNYLIENEIKGNILNISSVSGYRPAISPYMVTKRAINGLTEGLAKKLIKYGIVVNGIAPGPVATRMIGKDGTDLMYNNSPAKRYVSPVEVANLAVYLISDMARMIVGDTIYITGGCGNLTYDDIAY